MVKISTGHDSDEHVGMEPTSMLRFDLFDRTEPQRRIKRRAAAAGPVACVDAAKPVRGAGHMM